MRPRRTIVRIRVPIVGARLRVASMTWLALFDPVQQALKLAAKRGELCRGYLPDDGVIDSEVIMDEPVSHTGNLFPLHFGS
jgi:hypothetical protein